MVTVGLLLVRRFWSAAFTVIKIRNVLASLLLKIQTHNNVPTKQLYCINHLHWQDRHSSIKNSCTTLQKKWLCNDKIKQCHEMEAWNGALFCLILLIRLWDREEVDVSEDNVTPVGQKSHLIYMSCIGFPATICVSLTHKKHLWKKTAAFQIKWDITLHKTKLEVEALWTLEALWNNCKCPTT